VGLYGEVAVVASSYVCMYVSKRRAWRGMMLFSLTFIGSEKCHIQPIREIPVADVSQSANQVNRLTQYRVIIQEP
jgi:hypothetical protein